MTAWPRLFSQRLGVREQTEGKGREKKKPKGLKGEEAENRDVKYRNMGALSLDLISFIAFTTFYHVICPL